MLSRNLTALWAAIVAGGLILGSSLLGAEPPAQQQRPELSRRFREGVDEFAPNKKLSKEEIQKRADELRKKYPFESLAKRLAYEDAYVAAHKDQPAPKLNEEAAKELEVLEVSGQPRPFGGGMRTRGLQMVHSDQVERFITREGFGLMRLQQPSVHDLELANTEAVRYPRYLLDSTDDNDRDFRLITKSSPEQASPWNLPARELLFGYHLNGQLDFAGPLGLGLVRDRDHVAGFKSHQFRSVSPLVTKWDRDITKPAIGPNGQPLPPAKAVEEWVLRRLELVSLLKHMEPAVYVSATLPKMDDLAKADTRELSGFEADSLKSLRTGESLVARAKTNHLEMFGALRAAKQCQECHQVQRGELLGAFSYELHRNPAFKPTKEAASGN